MTPPPGPGCTRCPATATSAGGSDRADDGLRPGDLPDTPSGAAATKVREHWRQLRDAGHLDDPRLEQERATVRWHWATIAAAVALLVLAVAVTIVG